MTYVLPITYEDEIISIEYPPKNKGDVLNYDINIPLLEADGYKLFQPVELPETNRIYEVKYKEEDGIVIEYIDYKETQEEADEREFNSAKVRKHAENNQKAYAYEKIGTFSYMAESIQTGESVQVHIEFNVDNLSKFQAKLKAFEKGLYPEGKTTWLSQENIPIYINEEDCQNILLLIEKYDSYMWETLYLSYEIQIESATNVEEVNAIELVYNIPDLLQE